MIKPRLFITGLGVSLLGLLLAGSIETVISATDSGIRINEIMLNPGLGKHQWVELKNTGITPVNLSGYRFTTGKGVWYTLPSGLNDVPSGGFLIIYFAAGGSSVNPLGTTQGQLGLYSPSVAHFIHLPIVLNNYQSWNPLLPQPALPFPEPSIRAFVAWGAPPNNVTPISEPAAAAEKAGIWSRGWFIPLSGRGGLLEDDISTSIDQTIGLLPGSENALPGNWTLYSASQATRGYDNPVPVINFFRPSNGATVDGATFSLSWDTVTNATGYHFQLDTRIDFSSPSLVDKILTEHIYSAPMDVGTYFWRVKVLTSSGESPWSPAIQINTVSLTGIASDGEIQAVGNTKTLTGITYKWQLKDTYMLCLAGCQKDEWGQPHGAINQSHGRGYCAMASISMMASYYQVGKWPLSQDRIAYYYFSNIRNNPPESDLGHGGNSGIRAFEVIDVLTWALGVDKSAITYNQYSPFGPSFEEIKQWIDADRPILAGLRLDSIIGSLRHAVIIDGYYEVPGLMQYIHVVDPDNNLTQFISYATEDIYRYWVGPAGRNGAPNVRSDETSIWVTPFPSQSNPNGVKKDLDNDGIIDFDEIYRFHTDPNLKDSDQDGLGDKEEIITYLFESPYGIIHRRDVVRPILKEGSTTRRELDPDSDGGGNWDGCEDSNQPSNGFFEPNLGETRNDDPSDDKVLLITLSWGSQVGKDFDLHLMNPIGGDCYYGNKTPRWGFDAGQYRCGDPVLDYDCITGCTVEHITLSNLQNGTYKIKVHYYSDHGTGDGSPSVHVSLYDINNRKMIEKDFGPHTLSNNEVWDVCTINWPSGTITTGGTVSSTWAAGLEVRPGK